MKIKIFFLIITLCSLISTPHHALALMCKRVLNPLKILSDAQLIKEAKDPEWKSTLKLRQKILKSAKDHSDLSKVPQIREFAQALAVYLMQLAKVENKPEKKEQLLTLRRNVLRRLDEERMSIQMYLKSFGDYYVILAGPSYGEFLKKRTEDDFRDGLKLGLIVLPIFRQSEVLENKHSSEEQINYLWAAQILALESVVNVKFADNIKFDQIGFLNHDFDHSQRVFSQIATIQEYSGESPREVLAEGRNFFTAFTNVLAKEEDLSLRTGLHLDYFNQTHENNGLILRSALGVLSAKIMYATNYEVNLSYKSEISISEYRTLIDQNKPRLNRLFQVNPPPYGFVIRQDYWWRLLHRYLDIEEQVNVLRGLNLHLLPRLSTLISSHKRIRKKNALK